MMPNPDLPEPDYGADSPVGNLVDLGAGEILLPDFVSLTGAGLMLDPQRSDHESVRQFVDRVFAADAYFAGLDYAALLALLYPDNSLRGSTAPQPAAPVRLAAEICRLNPERRALYKGVKPMDQGARVEYVFEPVHIERVIETPQYGVDDNGMSVVVGHQQTVTAEPARLDADEFVAAMWLKGVRCGLDIAAIRDTISSGRTERIDIARRIEPTPGVDATVQELTEALHRDDSPAILPSGRIDLRHFKNRFPQIAADTPLLKKVSRQFGRLGFETDGSAIEPPLPRDFNITDLAGPGTRVERSANGEVVVAARDGFLNIDTQSQMISVNEKIISHEGVSLRTTGDLALSGDQFEEHGEVQERRVVEGRHMTFHADVFGSILSLGGRVHLLANLSGGQVRSTGGVIEVAQRVSQSLLEARDGEVILGQAEGATIVAGKVRIGRAVACDIIAEEIEIGEALACAITARQARIAMAGARKGVETLLSVWIPDFTSLDAQETATSKAIAAIEQKLEARQATLTVLLSHQELKVYLAAADSMRAGKVKLSQAQEAQWRQTTARLARPLQEVGALRDEIEILRKDLAYEREEYSSFKERRIAAGANVSCSIASIAGDVSVRTVSGPPGVPVYSGISAQEMKLKLRDQREARQRLFHGANGSFSWIWQDTTPDPPA